MFEPVDTDCPTIADVGIILCFTDQGAPHVAFGYRENNKPLQVAHLAFHYEFKKEPVSALTARFKCFGAPVGVFKYEERRKDFHGRLIAMQDRQKIPYAYRFDSRSFDRNFNYQGSKTGFGLTCASLVVSIFASYGVSIAKLETWQLRADDTEWQTNFLEPLRVRAGDMYVAQVAKNIPCIRVRPAEAAICATTFTPPLSFDQASLRANELIENVLALLGSAGTGG